MRLYELSQNYIQLQQMIEDGADVGDTLESIDEAIESKVENIAKLMKNIEGQIAVFQLEEKRLQAMRKTLENGVTRLKNNVYESMKNTGKRKIDGQLFKFAIQKNPPSVDVLNDSEIPIGYFIEQAPTLDKKAIMEELKLGHDVPGVQLKQGESLRIR